MNKMQAAESTQMDRLGLVLSNEVTFDEWASFAPRIKEALQSAAFAIGDWLVYGQERFEKQLYFEGMQPIPGTRDVPGNAYEAALAATGIPKATLKQYAYVSRNIPRDRRVEALSWEHHRMVAALEPPQQSEWLMIAANVIEQEGRVVSTRRLKRSIDQGRLLTIEESTIPPDKGQENHIPWINRLNSWFTNNADFIRAMDEEDKAMLRRDFAPVLKIINALAA